MSEYPDLPNPGSEEAGKLGCTCAVIDNHYGKGFLWGNEPEPVFWVNGDCPIHVFAEESEDEH